MSRPNKMYGTACFFCDYWLFLLTVIILFLTFIFINQNNAAKELVRLPDENSAGIPGPDDPFVGPTSDQLPIKATEVLDRDETVTIVPPNQQEDYCPETPTSEIRENENLLPEYIFAFIPVHWSGTMDEFVEVARQQGNFFVEESNMDAYFSVKFVIVEEVFDQGSLDDEDLLQDMLEYTIENISADRYIGITDSDLAPGGSAWTAGYTYGPDYQAVLSESFPVTITAHELGHTYGLCDEYNYGFWEQQNENYPNGCPNPYPDSCAKNTGVISECDGAFSEDGSYSIMASAIEDVDLKFNTASLFHLWDIFAGLSDLGVSE